MGEGGGSWRMHTTQTSRSLRHCTQGGGLGTAFFTDSATATKKKRKTSLASSLKSTRPARPISNSRWPRCHGFVGLRHLKCGPGVDSCRVPFGWLKVWVWAFTRAWCPGGGQQTTRRAKFVSPQNPWICSVRSTQRSSLKSTPGIIRGSVLPPRRATNFKPCVAPKALTDQQCIWGPQDPDLPHRVIVATAPCTGRSQSLLRSGRNNGGCH